MNARNVFRILSIGVFFLFCATGCRYPDISVSHTPVIATKDDQVKFTIEVLNEGDEPCTVQLLVNSVVVETFTGLRTGDIRTYTGGPYPAYENSTVSYSASIKDKDGDTRVRGYYYFGITGNSYNWNTTCIPARLSGSSADKEDIVFHAAADYSSLSDLIDDVADKIYDVYFKQDIIRYQNNLDNFNFWVYTRSASVSGCGTVDANASTEIPWRDVDAILHVGNLQDCTNLGLRHFTAEGGPTKAFLHESGHAVFGLADEYNGPTHYFEPSDEPNIFDEESGCRTEQTGKGREPDSCKQFTSRQGGWWGIHHLTDGTVMMIGNVGNPWGVEAKERVIWYFDQF